MRVPIITQKTESIDKIAANSGAYFSRVCGAGGGGVMAIFAPQDKKNNIIKNLKNHGVEVLPAKPVNQGLKCTHVD